MSLHLIWTGYRYKYDNFFTSALKMIFRCKLGCQLRTQRIHVVSYDRLPPDSGSFAFLMDSKTQSSLNCGVQQALFSLARRIWLLRLFLPIIRDNGAVCGWSCVLSSFGCWPKVYLTNRRTFTHSFLFGSTIAYCKTCKIWVTLTRTHVVECQTFVQRWFGKSHWIIGN